MKQIYQGDIPVIKISKEQLPKGLKFEKLIKDKIVAEGEITGHHHKLKVLEHTNLVEIAKDENGYYLKTNGGVELEHQQHDTIKIDKGIYFIGKQFEYDEVEKLKEVRD